MIQEGCPELVPNAYYPDPGIDLFVLLDFYLTALELSRLTQSKLFDSLYSLRKLRCLLLFHGT